MTFFAILALFVRNLLMKEFHDPSFKKFSNERPPVVWIFYNFKDIGQYQTEMISISLT